MSHRREHVVKVNSENGTERCTECSWRFPCRQADYCGHIDCLEFNAKAGREPRCYLCHGKLTGPHNTEAATWGVGELRGKTRSYHYCCRDQWALLPQAHRRALSRGYEFHPCDHHFADKLEAGQVVVQELQVPV